MRQQLLRVLALLAAFVLVAGACGDDDDDTTAAEDTTTTAGDETSDEGDDDSADTTTADDEAGADDGDEEGDGDDASGGGDVVAIEGGDAMNSILLPKCTGIAVFDQANEGAMEAAGELGVDEPSFVAPASCADTTGQLEFMANAVTQGVDAVMISNNAGDQIQTAVDEAAEAGIVVTAWDSPIPSGQGESLFVAQVDFDETGRVMADMALSILGDDGGPFAILSASPDAANQNAWIASMETALEDPQYENLELVDTVYGNDDADESYNQALALVDSHADLELIMAPTTVGIAAAAKAMQDEGLCEDVKVSGLGLPDEMADFAANGCSPEFALWSFVDLGYLTTYATYGIATGQIEAAEGVSFEAGRMGEYTIEADPTRDAGLRVVMGPFTVYTPDDL
ncbi:MAG: substrate-binding domain-containing protein [Actinomycetota bacterium]|nr:substrate-binding domain-containing protein [Actinomycetota bacterium]